MLNKKLTKNSKFYIRMRDSKLNKLSNITLFIDGSLVKIPRVCGNENCKCAKGKKHVSYYLTNKIKGKTNTIYIPEDKVREIKEWVTEHKRVKKIMKEIVDLQRVIIKKEAEERKREKQKKRIQ